MPHVKIRVAASVRQTIVLGAKVDAVSERIGSKCLQTVRQPSLVLHLQSIVAGSKAGAREHDCGKVWIERSYVDLSLLKQSSAGGSDVGSGKRLGRSERLLYARIPLKRVGQLQMLRIGKRIARTVWSNWGIHERRDNLRRGHRKTIWG